MMSLHALRSRSTKQAGKPTAARIAIQGIKKGCGDALCCGSAAAPSQSVTTAELRAAAVSAVPNASGNVQYYAFCCFPHASLALASGTGKQKTVPKDNSKPLISFLKIGAGEGIRTLDPNLGKVVLYP